MVTLERPRPKLGTEGDVVGKRVAAVLLDTIGFAIAYALITGIVGAVSDTLGALVGLLAGVAFLGYFVYFEAEYGQTVGKMALDVVVVTADGDPIGYQEAAIRTVLRLLDALPFLYLLGFVVVLVTDRKQRIGDLVADTVVVEADPGPGPL